MLAAGDRLRWRHLLSLLSGVVRQIGVRKRRDATLAQCLNTRIQTPFMHDHTRKKD